jgi:putative transposase
MRGPSARRRNDVAFAHDLVDGFKTQAAIADKDYDADHLVDEIADLAHNLFLPMWLG